MPSRSVRLRLTAVALAVAALLAVPQAAAQSADSTATAAADGPRRVVLTDGTSVVGAIDDEGADPLVIRLPNGIEQRVPRGQVRTITALYGGRFSRLDPGRSRLFITPTGRTLGRGNGRFSTFLYLFPGVAYGVTDRIDVSLGASIPDPTVLDEGLSMVLGANVKGQVLELASGGGVALGANVFVPIGLGADGVVGTFYGVATFGSETEGLTLGALGLYGSLLDDGDLNVSNTVVLLASYERQLSNSVKFITENALAVLEGGAGFGTLTGVRFFGDRLTADIAVAAASTEGDVGISPIPYLGLSYSF